MHIKQLKISNFRCYDYIELSFDQRINIFYGDNGSGKTSVLEAIYYLSTGKSFRSKRNKNLVKHGCDGLALFAAFVDQENNPHELGATLSKLMKKKVKLNQQHIKTQSDVAHVLPVVSIDPDSYLFLDKPPQYRRSFFDWLVFHVKPSYLETWSKVSRCHKHLNALYKEKKLNDLDYWEDQYVKFASQLTLMREEIFQQLKLSVQHKIKLFMPDLDSFVVSFRQGWGKDKTLVEQLESEREKNLLYGNLNSGTHKMDIKSTVKQQAAHENLSRGQKKIISSIFYLSYIELLTQYLGVHPILCLDDMDAELDATKTAVFSEFIQNSHNQIFLTTVEKDKLTPTLKKATVFHVKQNQIKPVVL